MVSFLSFVDKVDQHRGDLFGFIITVEEEVDGINSVKEDEMIGNDAKGKVKEEMESGAT